MRGFATATAMLVATLACAGTADAEELFKATLSGGQEVPAVDTPASGKAFFRLLGSGDAVEVELHVSDGVGITQAHIHCAPAGVNGAVVVFLAGLHAAGLDVDGKWIGNATFTDASIVNFACGASVAELAESMRAGNTYANVHSLDFPAGEIRGQIEPTQ